MGCGQDIVNQLMDDADAKFFAFMIFVCVPKLSFFYVYHARKRIPMFENYSKKCSPYIELKPS